MVSPWRTTTEPEACFATFPVSNEISVPAISTVTVVGLVLLIVGNSLLARSSVGAPFRSLDFEQTQDTPAFGASPRPR